MWIAGLFFLFVSACSLFFAGNSYDQIISFANTDNASFLLVASFMAGIFTFIFLGAAGHEGGKLKGIKQGVNSALGKPLGAGSLELGHHYHTVSTVERAVESAWLCIISHVETEQIRFYALPADPPKEFVPTRMDDTTIQLTDTETGGPKIDVPDTSPTE